MQTSNDEAVVSLVVDASGLQKGSAEAQALGKRIVDSLDAIKTAANSVGPGMATAGASIVKSLGDQARFLNQTERSLNPYTAAVTKATGELNRLIGIMEKGGEAGARASGMIEAQAQKILQLKIVATGAADAANGFNAAWAQAEQTLQRAISGLSSLISKFEPSAASARQMTSELANLNAAMKQGLVTEEQAIILGQKITNSYNEGAIAAQKLAESQAKLISQSRASQNVQNSQDFFNKTLGVNPTSGVGNAQQSASVFQRMFLQEEAEAENARRSVGNLTLAHGKWTQALFLNRIGLMELQAAGVNTFQALASGMNVTHVAMMEGAQVIGALVQGTEGGFTRLAKAIVSPIGLITTGVLAFSAGLAVVLTRTVSNEQQLKRFDEALKTSGANFSTVSSGLQKLSFDLRAMGLSAADAEASIMSLARNGNINLNNPNAIRSVTQLGVNVGARLGVGDKAGIDEVTKAIDGGAKALVELALRLKVVNADEAANILINAGLGKGLIESESLIKRLTTATIGEQEKLKTGFTRFIDSIGSGWQALLNKISSSTASSGIDSLLERMANNLKIITETGGLAPGTFADKVRNFFSSGSVARSPGQISGPNIYNGIGQTRSGALANSLSIRDDNFPSTSLVGPDSILQQSNARIAEQIKALEELKRESKDATDSARLWGVQQQAQTAFTSKYNEVLKLTEDSTKAWNQANIEFNKTRDVGLIGLSKAIILQDLETQGILKTVAAYKLSIAAGLESAAAEAARIKVLQQGGGNVEDEKRVLLEASARAAVLSSKEQIAANQLILDSAEKVAQASGRGAAVQHEAELQAQALAKTQDVLAKAQASYNANSTETNRILLEQAKASRDVELADLRRADAAKQLQGINQEIRGQGDQQRVLQLEISLQGQSNEEITRRVSILQAALNIQEKYPGLWTEDKQRLLDVDTATANWVKRLTEAQQAQSRFDDGIRNIASTIDSTLTKSITDAFDGKKVTDWGATIKKTLGQIIADLASSQFLKPLTGTILQALGLGSAGSSFGNFNSLLGIGGGSSGGQIQVGSDGTLKLVSEGLGGIGKVGGLFSSGGLFGGGSSVASGTGALADSIIASGGSSTGGALSSASSSSGGFLSSLFGGGGGGLGSLSSLMGIGGALIGGIGLLGSLFGLFDSKPKNQLSGANIDPSTGQIISSFSGGNNKNTDAANQITNSLSTFASGLVKLTGGTIGGGSIGVTVGTNTGISINDAFGSQKFGTDSGRAISVVELEMAKRLEGVSETVKKVVDQITDPSQLQSAIQFAQVYDNLKTAADSAFSGIASDTQKIGPFADALNQIKVIFQGLTEQANLFGLSLEPVNKGLEEVTKRLQGDFIKSINDASLAISDPIGLLVQQEKEANKVRLDEAKALGAGEIEVNKLDKLILDKLWKDQTANLISLETELKTGALSGMTISGQLSAANDNFKRELGLVKGGNLAEIGGLATAGTNVVSLSQTSYGNAPQTARIRADVLTAVDDVLASRSFASGTSSTPPGMILVGENGPEWMMQGGGNRIFGNGNMGSSGGNGEMMNLLRDVISELRGNNSISREHGKISERGFDKVVNSLDRKKFEENTRTKVA